MDVNNTRDIVRLVTDGSSRRYAETPEDAIDLLYRSNSIESEQVMGSDGVLRPRYGVIQPTLIPGVTNTTNSSSRYGRDQSSTYRPAGRTNTGNLNRHQSFYSSAIERGIHSSYIKDMTQRFGQHRANYEFETKFLRNGYTSFSGADTTVTALFKGGEAVVLGEIQTISYSIFTPTVPVYNLGSNKPSGYVKGPRTVAGTIIFTVFDRHALISAFHYAYSKVVGAKCLDKEYLSDELPPFDLQITFLNEYGQSSGMIIHDVRITTEGQTMSIEDMITENTMQYMATDITLMRHNYIEEPY